MVKKYTRSDEEQAFIKMFQNGITTGDKAKIIKARKFPKNTANNFDLFKSYFLSGEGLKPLIKELSEKEIVVLHILSFNTWIVDISAFEAAYLLLPKQNKHSWTRHQTFTQKYGALLKVVLISLVQKGLLIQYEDLLGGKSKTERMRFIFPSAFAQHLPPPFFSLKKLEGIGTYKEESSRRNLLDAIQKRVEKAANVISLQHKKLYLGKVFFNLMGLEKLQLRTWQISDHARILYNTYMDETTGNNLSVFLIDQLKKLPNNQWFSSQSLSALLEVWDDTRARKSLNYNQSLPARYNIEHFCETGWEAGLLQKKKHKGTAYYRLIDEETTAILPDEYLILKEQGAVAVNLKLIPFSDLAILSQIVNFNSSTSSLPIIEPDLVNIASIPATVWEHPLMEWLKKHATSFKEAFAYFQKHYGKELIHQNLLVAKIEDLSLRVLVEKELQKKHEVILLSENFIAFPKEALGVINKIVTKSGNVIKKVTSS